MKRVAAVVFVTEDGKVVLQRKTKDHPTKSDMLALFGGQIEGGETAEQAIKREVNEETSLPTPLFEKIAEQHWYVAKVPSGDFEDHEGAGAETFDIDEALARNDLTYSTRYALERLKYESKI